MDQEKLEALLGRSLTSIEETNRELYLNIAQENIEDLLCISLDVFDESGEQEADSLTFDVREGYSTVFTGIFTELSEVKVDGDVATDYHAAFWNKKSNPYYNSIVLDNCEGVSEVEITGLWGFAEIPNDLELLWAQAFANVSKTYKPGDVKSKQVEDFRVTYGDLTDDQSFTQANARVIKKYSLCNVGYVLHGDVCELHRARVCGFCF